MLFVKIMFRTTLNKLKIDRICKHWLHSGTMACILARLRGYLKTKSRRFRRLCPIVMRPLVLLIVCRSWQCVP
jgi:hypothetical protein